MVATASRLLSAGVRVVEAGGKRSFIQHLMPLKQLLLLVADSVTETDCIYAFLGCRSF